MQQRVFQVRDSSFEETITKRNQDLFSHSNRFLDAPNNRSKQKT